MPEKCLQKWIFFKFSWVKSHNFDDSFCIVSNEYAFCKAERNKREILFIFKRVTIIKKFGRCQVVFVLYGTYLQHSQYTRSYQTATYFIWAMIIQNIDPLILGRSLSRTSRRSGLQVMKHILTVSNSYQFRFCSHYRLGGNKKNSHKK